MPTFTEIALDRLLDHRSSRNPQPKSLPPLPVKLERPPPLPQRPQASPILYATPETTPLPDSPSSFPPSPYIVNHKRRGPRLLKSFSQSDVGVSKPLKTDNEVTKAEELADKQGEGVVNGSDDRKVGEGNLAGNEKSVKSVEVEVDRDVEGDDFFDFQDSLSVTSNTEVDESSGGERMWRPGTPVGEYYDAFEEISSDGATRSSCRNVEDELREMRLNLLTEIERRKQAEEAIENFQNQWQRLSFHLARVGLMLPALPTSTDDSEEQSSIDPAEDLCQQVLIARYVAGSMGRGCSRAEVEQELEPQIVSKNFEIARLSDRLQYYEAANREMSQRNQEAVEMARQERHKRKRRQKWIWSTIGLAVTLGAGAIAWSYLPATKSSSPQGGDATTSQID